MWLLEAAVAVAVEGRDRGGEEKEEGKDSGGGGGTHLWHAFSYLTIDDASISRRSTGGGGEGEPHFMHSCSHITIDPRILTMPGRSTSGFHRPGRHRVHLARSAVRCSARRMKSELHPHKNHLRGGLPRLVRTFLHVDDSFDFSFFWCGHFQRPRRGGRGGTKEVDWEEEEEEEQEEEKEKEKREVRRRGNWKEEEGEARKIEQGTGSTAGTRVHMRVPGYPGTRAR